MDTESSFKPCECCETKIIGKPWMSVRYDMQVYHVCSHTCSTRFTEKYGGGYWDNIINKEDFNEPRPVFEVYKIKQKKDITNGFDIEEIRKEIEENNSSEEEYYEYSSTDEDFYDEENY